MYKISINPYFNMQKRSLDNCAPIFLNSETEFGPRKREYQRKPNNCKTEPLQTRRPQHQWGLPSICPASFPAVPAASPPTPSKAILKFHSLLKPLLHYLPTNSSEMNWLLSQKLVPSRRSSLNNVLSTDLCFYATHTALSPPSFVQG